MRLLDFGNTVFSSSPENLLVGGFNQSKTYSASQPIIPSIVKKRGHILNPPTSLSSGKKHVDGFVV
jgi:hypothetical protein